MSLMRSMRGGKDYDSEWGKRMNGAGPYAWQIGRRFEIAARKLGLNMEKRPLRNDLFVAPERAGKQLMLLYKSMSRSGGRFSERSCSMKSRALLGAVV